MPLLLTFVLKFWISKVPGSLGYVTFLKTSVYGLKEEDVGAGWAS